MKNSPRSQLRESELQLNDLRPDTTTQNKILSPLVVSSTNAISK